LKKIYKLFKKVQKVVSKMKKDLLKVWKNKEKMHILKPVNYL